ncbi:MAG: hypothetical protein V7K47_29280 [Nostoc sp.]
MAVRGNIEKSKRVESDGIKSRLYPSTIENKSLPEPRKLSTKPLQVAEVKWVLMLEIINHQ